MESIPESGASVDIQLTQEDSHGRCLSIPLFNCKPTAHLIKLSINGIKQVNKPSLKYNYMKTAQLSASGSLPKSHILSVQVVETEQGTAQICSLSICVEITVYLGQTPTLDP